MLSGAFQGSMLRFISRNAHTVQNSGNWHLYRLLYDMSRPAGSADNGVLHTIEVNDELRWIISKYIHLAGLEKGGLTFW
jgi:hypothetical protein